MSIRPAAPNVCGVKPDTQGSGLPCRTRRSIGAPPADAPKASQRRVSEGQGLAGTGCEINGHWGGGDVSSHGFKLDRIVTWLVALASAAARQPCSARKAKAGS